MTERKHSLTPMTQCDIPLPSLVDVTGLLLVIVSVAHMAKRAGNA